MDTLWKSNWEETKRHFRGWWNRSDLVTAIYGKVTERTTSRIGMSDPGRPDPRTQYTDKTWRSNHSRYNASMTEFVADNLPLYCFEQGPGALSMYLGSEPGFNEETIWYHSCIEDPETYPAIRFDPTDRCWLETEEATRHMVKESGGNYFVGFPDLIENVDILSSLRGGEQLMMDFMLRPDWVKTKVAEINQAYFKVYDRIYDIIKLPDGSSCFSAFALWSPGKCAKVQCDASAMFSPAMFEEFVVPGLTEQCEWLDHSMYHLDGTQAICHLDALLQIEPLDAIEWTPQSGMPGGGDPMWYDLYKRTLAAGKSVQAFTDKKDVLRLLDSVGGKGMYLMIFGIDTVPEYEAMMKRIEGYR